MPQIHTVIVGIQGPPGSPGDAGRYETTFTEASLSIAGALIVNHGLNRYPAGIAIYTASGDCICPDDLVLASTNAIAVYLASFRPLQGTWSISVM